VAEVPFPYDSVRFFWRVSRLSNSFNHAVLS